MYAISKYLQSLFSKQILFKLHRGLADCPTVGKEAASLFCFACPLHCTQYSRSVMRSFPPARIQFDGAFPCGTSPRLGFEAFHRYVCTSGTCTWHECVDWSALPWTACLHAAVTGKITVKIREALFLSTSRGCFYVLSTIANRAV